MDPESAKLIGTILDNARGETPQPPEAVHKARLKTVEEGADETG